MLFKHVMYDYTSVIGTNIQLLYMQYRADNANIFYYYISTCPLMYTINFKICVEHFRYETCR
jgi:lipid-A-disaccharide synthase-like uncharacterized protein